jgi:alginate O-acetyltransferase complex protein AlgI
MSEFWRRWHITLTKFFRDCFYAPIFGKKKSYFGVIVMLAVVGLWHGASANFIILGLLFGLLLAAEMRVGRKRMKKIPSAVAHIYTKIVIVIGFGMFCFEDFGALGRFLKALVGLGAGFTDSASNVMLLRYSFLFIASAVLSLPIIPAVKKWAENEGLPSAVVSAVRIVCNVVLLIISSVMMINSSGNTFLYFRF